MLREGFDSYATLEEAEEILSLSFIESNEAYKNWRTLTDRDKEALLRQSCSSIDSLNFDGRRKVYGQKLEFPRVSESYCGIGYRLFIGQLYDNGLYGSSGSDGLYEAKQAQVINAAYAGLFDSATTNLLEVTIQGLSSKKAGPISETYNRDKRDTTDVQIGIYTKKVYSILKPWINDSRISL